MRYFADRERVIAPRAVADGLAGRLAEAAALPPGAVRHGALAGLLVRAAELAQGIADAERAAAGADRWGPGERAAMTLTGALGRALWRSWRAGGVAPVPPRRVLEPLCEAPLPGTITIRRAEGFALYAVYPETYAAAGARLAGAGAAVLGVRSIGTALAAMVAAGAGLRMPAVTVRPVGDPYRRRVRLAPALAAELRRTRGPFAVADEGPGRSGSSLVAVAEALGALGLPPGRIQLFPSHPGPPGGAGPAGISEAYARLARHHVPFEALFLSDAPLALPRLVEDLVGPVDGPPRDVSAGAWRRELFGDPRGWPPSEGWRERRKYLVDAGGRRWLARFAGLGDAGERALRRSRALAAAGLVPAPAGLRHGFLVERFEGSALPLPLAALPRTQVLGGVRRYVVFVASRLQAEEGDDGASPLDLAEVASDCARTLLGPAAGRDLGRLAARIVPEVRRLARPVAVDGRLQRWEWLVRQSGVLVKTDALDHHADHALVGCQDALWDVAGAAIELGLTAAEAGELAAAVRAAAPGAPPRCLPFYLAAYAAFEAGRWADAAEEGGVEPDEAARRRAEAVRLSGALRRVLAAGAAELPSLHGTTPGPG